MNYEVNNLIDAVDLKSKRVYNFESVCTICNVEVTTDALTKAEYFFCDSCYVTLFGGTDNTVYCFHCEEQRPLQGASHVCGQCVKDSREDGCM